MKVFITYNNKERSTAVRLYTLASLGMDELVFLPDRFNNNKTGENTTRERIDQCSVIIFFGEYVKKKARKDMLYAQNKNIFGFCFNKYNTDSELFASQLKGVLELFNNRSVKDRNILTAVLIMAWGLWALENVKIIQKT